MGALARRERLIAAFEGRTRGFGGERARLCKNMANICCVCARDMI